MRHHLTRLATVAASCLLCGCLQPQNHQAEVILVGNGMGSPSSTNLAADIEAMWSVAPMPQGRNWVAASVEADSAALRVFNTVNLIGMSRDEVTRSLRLDLRSKNYGYCAPFYPVSTNALAVRIDNGHYGWQFNVVFGDGDRVIKVERHGIE